MRAVLVEPFASAGQRARVAAVPLRDRGGAVLLWEVPGGGREAGTVPAITELPAVQGSSVHKQQHPFPCTPPLSAASLGALPSHRCLQLSVQVTRALLLQPEASLGSIPAAHAAKSLPGAGVPFLLSSFVF